jgi:alanine-glyoxylate transaminase/serine-glyoxylate transaminase/serine-pyruvate transaminase
MVETGQFAALWKGIAIKLGLVPEIIETDWRRGAPPEAIADRLTADKGREIKAVCVVHNETSTGATSRIADIRRAIDATGHPALFLVDSISGLASADLQHDAWGIDVTIAGSQKGLMLPPGLSFNAISNKALDAHKRSTLPKTYWDWSEMLSNNARGYFPYTPATNMLYGLDAAIDMLLEEGLDAVFARHHRHALATRKCVAAWGLEVLCQDEREHSPVLTGVVMPDGHSADKARAAILEGFDISLGTGLGKVADKIFRIGHLGDINDVTLMGTLAGVEMGLRHAGVPIKGGGVLAAMDHLTTTMPGSR